jgi:hypothetical protein
MTFAAQGDVKIIVPSKFKDRVKNILELGKVYSLTISTKATLVETASGGVAKLVFEDASINMKDGAKRSMHLNDTLRGVESMIFFVQNNRDPTDDERDFIHEALLEEFAPRVLNPINEKTMILRTSAMNNRELFDYTDKVISFLASLDIPEEVMESIGLPAKELFKSWYDWRYNHHGVDPLHDVLPGTWNKYCIRYPVCEFTFVGGTTGDPLEQMHIVSRGSDDKDRDEPWNWIRARHSVHMEQHAYGWDYILEKYPHMKGKVKAARVLAGKKEL